MTERSQASQPAARAQTLRPSAYLIRQAFMRTSTFEHWSMTSKGLQLEINAADDLPPHQADGDRILRVLSNLLDNARKFTDSPGRVVISVKPTTTGVLFSVSNTGTPAPPAELEAMFKPFWQAQSDRNGTGLGLAICRSMSRRTAARYGLNPPMGRGCASASPCLVRERRVELLRRQLPSSYSEPAGCGRGTGMARSCEPSTSIHLDAGTHMTTPA